MSDDTVREILDATHRALREHGYASLTMRDIADESDVSKAALHYHFGGKQDLLESFLDDLLEQFQRRLSNVEGEDPAVQLHGLIETVLSPSRDDDHSGFETAVLEVKAQAPYEPAYRERLSRFDETLRSRVAAIVSDGIEDGTFDSSVDPEEAAAFVVTHLNGIQTRYVGVGVSLDAAERRLHRYVERALRDGDVDAEGSR